MNNYHRYINLPFIYPKPKLFNTQPNKWQIVAVPPEEIYQPLLDWFKPFGDKHNIKISKVLEAFYTAPSNKFHIHNDSFYLSNMTKLNFTWGPTNSLTRWWKIKDEKNLKTLHYPVQGSPEKPDIIPNRPHDYDNATLAEEEDCQIVYEKVIDKPSLLNVGHLHSVYNPNKDQGRWTLCFILLKNDGSLLEFLDAVEIFKDIVYE
jgi:hypothetical protein